MIEEQIKQGRVLLDFYADWCSPCKTMEPIIEQFSNEQDKVNVIKVNVDSHSEMANVYGIRSIPTLIYLNKGDVIDRSTGALPIDELYKFTKLND